jgi:hypothetical protein
LWPDVVVAQVHVLQGTRDFDGGSEGNGAGVCGGIFVEI